MTNIAASTDPVFEYPYAMVDYASSMTLELRHGGSGSSGYDVRLGFRNSSSADGDLTYYPLFGTNDVDMDLDTFVSKLQVSSAEWLSACLSRHCPAWGFFLESGAQSDVSTSTLPNSPLSFRTTPTGARTARTTEASPPAPSGPSLKSTKRSPRRTSTNPIRTSLQSGAALSARVSRWSSERWYSRR